VDTVRRSAAVLFGRPGQPDGIATRIPQQVDAVQHGGGLMAGDRLTSDASPGRRHAEGVTLARIGSGRFDGGPGRVHAVTHPHQVARPRQRPELRRRDPRRPPLTRSPHRLLTHRSRSVA